MRRLPTLVLVATLLPSLPWISLASAQSSGPASNLSLAQAERVAVDLKQGMTVEEVQSLLGKPRRTTFKNYGSFSNAPGQGILQWTYTWTGSSSSSEGNLRVVFAAKTPDQWYVDSWDWTTY
jgi:hypothetical protein